MPRAKVSFIRFFFFFFLFLFFPLLHPLNLCVCDKLSYLYLCRQTGGRKATKMQRRLGFSIHDELDRLSSPSSS